MSFALPASLLQQGEDILPDIEWENNRLFEGANERVYNNFGVELPGSSRQTVSAARRAAQYAAPLITVGGAAVTYASKYIPALGVFEEVKRLVPGNSEPDDDKAFAEELLVAIKQVNKEDKEMASNKRAKVGGEPSNTTQVTSVDGEPRVVGASAVPLQNSSSQERPPLMDRLTRAADISNIPMQQEAARVLNTVEPTCCRKWKVWDYKIGINNGGALMNIASNTQLSESVVVIAQGVGDNQRIGTRILLHCIEIRYNTRTLAPASFFQPGRVMLIYDNQSQGGAYDLGPSGIINSWASDATSGVLEAYVAGASTPTNFYSRQNRDRYEVLMDRFLMLGGASPGTANGGQSFDVGWQIIPMHNREVVYATASTNGRSIISGAVWLCVVGGNGTTNLTGHLIEGNIRVYFSEKADHCT
jgi:hypothetical protein